MDVWHRSGERQMAAYWVHGVCVAVVGVYGVGTPVGQFDRFELRDAASGESLPHAGRLFDLPTRDEVERLLAAGVAFQRGPIIGALAGSPNA